jgi:hypothetical protein
MKVSVAVGGSLNRIPHHALPFFVRPSEGRSRRAGPPKKRLPTLCSSRAPRSLWSKLRAGSCGTPFRGERFGLKARERIVGLPEK